MSNIILAEVEFRGLAFSAQTQLREGTSARDLLRSATADIHDRMHRHPGFAAAASGTIDHADYRRLLARAYGFYQPFEVNLVPRWTPLLADDLTALGLPRAAIEQLPLCAGVPTLASSAARWGGAYVVEGAALGGEAMAKALKKSGAAFPVRFLESGGAKSAGWRPFLVELERELADDDSRECAVHAAVASFSAYAEWMEEWRDHDIS